MLVTRSKADGLPVLLTKYTAPKLPWPISRRSVNSFSGSSLQNRSATSGSFRLPARAFEGMARAWRMERVLRLVLQIEIRVKT